MFATVTAALLHPIWTYFLLVYFDLGIVGTGISMCLTQFLTFMFNYTYTKYLDEIKEAVV
jgi:Na+-driven multidrug efflux pump